MSLSAFLQPARLLQTIVLALSIFNLVAFLWLAITVWLNGDRRTGIARLGVTGLCLSALFFFIHSILIFNTLPPLPGSPTPLPSLDTFEMDLLWHLVWIPALGVPYIWFAIGLHYAALINKDWRRRRPFLLVLSGILGCIELLLLIRFQSTFTFVGTLRLLTYNSWAAACNSSPCGFPAPTLPLLLVPGLFLFYVTFCAIGPWFTPGRISRLLRVLWTHIRQPGSLHKQPLHRVLEDAFWDDPTDIELLKEPVLSWHLARPGLLLAALLMVCLTTILAILGVSSILDWLLDQPREVAPAVTISIPLPLNLIGIDLSINGAVALIVLLIGYSIVRHGILIERPLARRGFLEQWHGIVIVTTAVAIFIALLVTFTRSNLGGLLLITLLATVAYALFTWSSYTARDRFITLLGPFLRSTSLRHWLNTDQQKTEQDLEDLFFHLCQDVLAVQCAHLTILAGSVRRTFSYRWPEDTRYIDSRLITPLVASGVDAHRVQLSLQGQPMLCWVLPIYDELGLVATLYLGPRQDGGAFTDEDMNLAHACGQRILDTLSDHEAMQAVAGLLRRRIVDVKLLGAQQRRVLHDEILPQMHLALLRLETLRSLPGLSGIPENRLQNLSLPVSTFSPIGEEIHICPEQVLNEAIDVISDAHRRLAAMMRATTVSAPHRLERDGLMHAIRAMLEQDFQNSFDEVKWDVADEIASYIDEVTPPAIAELIFAAVQEALRNSARHARGSDVHRCLCMMLKASCNPHLEVIVADDGVGIASASSTTIGTGSGLLTHSALLAIAGGSLTIKSAPGEGVTVRILLPAESLRR